MPLVNIKVPEGSLTPEKKQRMIELVTDAVVEAEGFTGNERVREITWITIDEVPEGNWGAAGETVTLKKLGKYVTGDKSITETFAGERAAAGAPSVTAAPGVRGASQDCRQPRTPRRSRMSTVEQKPKAAKNGSSAKGQIPVVNPATGEVVAHVPDMKPKEVKDLVAQARAAQPEWEALGFEARAELMLDMKAWVVDNRQRITQTIVDETGKTFEDAQIGEVFFAADSLSFWGKKAPEYLGDERVKTHTPTLWGKKLYVRYRPYGVVGVIGPWNYPLTNCFLDGAARAHGRQRRRVQAERGHAAHHAAHPGGAPRGGAARGVMQVATGRGATGAALIDEVDMVHFTGLRRHRQEGDGARPPRRLTPVSLELGGKDPMIVLRDADVDRAANAAVFWAHGQRRADLHRRSSACTWRSRSTTSSCARS